MANKSERAKPAIGTVGRLVTCCLTLASVQLLNSAAFGAIHYYYGDLSVPQGYDQPVDLNFENDDYDDVIFENFVYPQGNYQGLYVPYSPGKVVGFSSAGVQYVTALSVGATIDSNTLGSSYYGALSFGSEYPAAQFTTVTDAFIGLAFPVGPVNLHYAWVRVSVDNAAGTLYIKDWAFEDQPGVGITAGDTGNLPIYGDFNGDRHVSGADFLMWQRGYPDTFTIFDYWKWENNYGAGSGLPLQAQVATVPEPGCLLLLLLGSVPLLSRRTRRF